MCVLFLSVDAKVMEFYENDLKVSGGAGPRKKKQTKKTLKGRKGTRARLVLGGLGMTRPA